MTGIEVKKQKKIRGENVNKFFHFLEFFHFSAANYEYYDYNDYDVYAYDEEKDEKLKENFQLRQELQEILNKLNVSTSTEAPAALPNAVRFFLVYHLSISN